MELRSIDGGSYISLTDREVGDFGFKAAIAVRDRDFAGAHDQAWFSYDALVAFVEALRRFSVAHEGEARLESSEALDPDSLGEVVLSIRGMGMARHVLMEAQVSHWYYRRHGYFVDKVSVAFELDPSQLLDVVRQLEAIVAEAELTWRS